MQFSDYFHFFHYSIYLKSENCHHRGCRYCGIDKCSIGYLQRKFSGIAEKNHPRVLSVSKLLVAKFEYANALKREHQVDEAKLNQLKNAFNDAEHKYCKELGLVDEGALKQLENALGAYAAKGANAVKEASLKSKVAEEASIKKAAVKAEEAKAVVDEANTAAKESNTALELYSNAEADRQAVTNLDAASNAKTAKGAAPPAVNTLVEASVPAVGPAVVSPTNSVLPGTITARADLPSTLPKKAGSIGTGSCSYCCCCYWIFFYTKSSKLTTTTNLGYDESRPRQLCT